MDEIIYLEPDEEITSVIDKIKNASSTSLGLVVPRDATILQSVVNLRLLSREAASLSKTIAIVTADRIGRNLAAQVGLMVYSSVKEDRPKADHPWAGKPTFAPPPPEHSNQEVIELDATPQNEPETVDGADNLRVHHFQDTRPVIHWKAQQKPAFVPKVKPEREKPVAPAQGWSASGGKINRELDPRLKKIIWPIIGVFLVLAGVAFYLLYPRAEVQVFMQSEDLNKAVILTIEDARQSASIDQNIFPGEMVEAFAENIEKFPTTGKKNVGEKAKGSVTVYNYWESSARTFAAGTKFLSSSKTFVAPKSFSVPGTAIKEGNLVAGTANIGLEAETPGEDSNVKAGKFIIVGLPTAQQEKIYGNATNDFSGGFSREVAVVSQDDYDKAKTKLLENLSSTVDKDLATKAKNKKILEKAVVASDPEVISSSGVDQEASEFEMKVRLHKQVMAFDFTSFTAFLTQILEKQVASDKMVAIPSEADFGLVVDKTAYDTKVLNLTANVQAKIASRIDAEKIKTAIMGKSQSAAESYIKSQEGVAKVEFVFRPSWLKRISDLSRNVQVEIKYLTE